MTRLSLRLPECGRGATHQYASTLTLHSDAVAGVSFTIRRMSFGRRIELYRLIRELAVKAPFIEASEDVRDRLEANLLACEIERLYIEWGLVDVAGLTIDGEAATRETLLARGPEPLCREIAGAVRRECGLTDDERKN